MVLQDKKLAPDFSLPQIITNLLILFMSFCASLQWLHVLKLVVPHKYGIENTSSFAPESSYPVLVLIVLTTVGLYAGLQFLRRKRHTLFRYLVIAFLALSFFIGISAPYFASLEHNVDTFHHGEMLAPAIAFDHGKVPYKDLFVLHGAGEDVIVPWLSLKIFGNKIGSLFFVDGLLQLATVVVFFWMLHKLFKHDLAFIGIGLWFLMSSFATLNYSRDIPTYLSILLLYYLFTRAGPQPYKQAALGLLASASLFYSFDRGTFLTLILGVSVLVWLFFDRRDTFRFDPRNFTSRLRSVLPAIGGFLGGILVAFILLRPSGFVAFIQVLLQATKYQGAIFNYPFPGLDAAHWVFWIPAMGFVVLLLILAHDLRQTKFRPDPQLMFELIMLVLSALYFRASTGRPDPGHIAYGSIVLLITFSFVVYRRILVLANAKPRLRRPLYAAYAPALVVVFLALLPPAVSYLRLAEFHQTPLSDTKLYLNSVRLPDTFWTDDRLQHTTSRVQQLTKPTDKIFAFADEPIWYYTTRRSNPTRFSISWFADPAPLEAEMLRDLKKSPPKVIIYEAGKPFNDSPDFIPMKTRLPQVNKWILQNYHQRQTVDGVVLLTK